MTLHIGVARADITPPVGIPMVGFAGRDVSEAVHDPLTATALVATDGERQAVLVCMDLLFLRGETVAEFRQAIFAATGIAPSNIALACAHNHYGPDVDRAGDAALVAAYRENLKYLLAGIVGQARREQRPARLGVGWGVSEIGVNRRERKPDGRIVLGQNPTGPVDRQVGVLRVAGIDGRPLACLVNFACHPVCQGGRMGALSADFPGRMRQVVEELTGAPCLFLQGACGDLNPVLMEHAYEPARTLGTRLGCEVVKIWEGVYPQEVSGLQVAVRTISLPRYRYGSAAQATGVKEELEKELKELAGEPESASRRWWTERRLQRVSEVVESWQSGRLPAPIAAELQAWRLGELGIAMAPGEIFNQIGQQVKKGAPFTDTFFAGYANGSVGYVPVREAYPEGGYEVTHACQVDPEAGDLVERGCLELLAGLSES